jgi:hypothetical protein
MPPLQSGGAGGRCHMEKDMQPKKVAYDLYQAIYIIVV